MSKDMLGSVVRAAVSVPQERLELLAKLASIFSDRGRKGEQWYEKLFRLYQEGLPKTPILDTLITLSVPETNEQFVARMKFVVDPPSNGMSFNEEFIEWFLSGDGKVEDPIGGQTLCCAQLLDTVFFAQPIINELGGEKKAETTLTELFYLIERQKNGQLCMLNANGKANRFFIRDCNKILRDIDMAWSSVYVRWCLRAQPIEDKDTRSAGDKVFFRLSTSIYTILDYPVFGGPGASIPLVPQVHKFKANDDEDAKAEFLRRQKHDVTQKAQLYKKIEFS